MDMKDADVRPNGKDLFATLIMLLADQEGVIISYELEGDNHTSTTCQPHGSYMATQYGRDKHENIYGGFDGRG